MKQEDQRGISTYNAYAIRANIAKTEQQMAKWMHKKGQLCVKCQKQSVAEKGCSIRMMPGLKLYICKACVDAKRLKGESHD